MAVPKSMLDRFKVETEFGDGYVVNTTYNWEYSTRQQAQSVRWDEVVQIGAGTFGSVWLERAEGGQLRAVKRLQRESGVGFTQELLALITLADASLASLYLPDF